MELTTLSKEDIITAIGNMSVLELNELVKEIEKRFGVSAAAPMMAGMSDVLAEEAGVSVPEVEEQTEFDVALISYGIKKIQVIKTVRELTNLGLREAKDAVENLGEPIEKGVTKEKAEEMKDKLEKVGATVEIK